MTSPSHHSQHHQHQQFVPHSYAFRPFIPSKGEKLTGDTKKAADRYAEHMVQVMAEAAELHRRADVEGKLHRIFSAYQGAEVIDSGEKRHAVSYQKTAAEKRSKQEAAKQMVLNAYFQQKKPRILPAKPRVRLTMIAESESTESTWNVFRQQAPVRLTNEEASDSSESTWNFFRQMRPSGQDSSKNQSADSLDSSDSTWHFFRQMKSPSQDFSRRSPADSLGESTNSTIGSTPSPPPLMSNNKEMRNAHF